MGIIVLLLDLCRCFSTAMKTLYSLLGLTALFLHFLFGEKWQKSCISAAQEKTRVENGEILALRAKFDQILSNIESKLKTIQINYFVDKKTLASK